jgi:hypothetical protein
MSSASQNNPVESRMDLNLGERVSHLELQLSGLQARFAVVEKKFWKQQEKKRGPTKTNHKMLRRD